MRVSTCLASTGALLALMAFKQHTASVDALKLRPTVTHAAKGTKGTQRTAAVSDVVNAANTFLASLSSSQQGSVTTTAQGAVLQPFNAANVIRWSNFPYGIYNNRLGLRLDAMTSAQRTLALAVVQAATGTTANEGYDEIQQLRAADDNLATSNSNSYGNGIYYIAFEGTPSTTGIWMLSFGGHHLATNITFGNGNVMGTTPKFEGVEPLSFTTTNANVFATGTTLAPQAQEQAAMLAMINGLTTAQKATAKLSQTYGDVVVGPQKDGQFPTTASGLPCSQLSSSQQALVVAAMAPWVKDADDATGTALLNYYQTQLANTYIAYAGTGNFTTNGDYARIDGPNCWIEFSVQNGVVYQNQVHYHTVYRDRARDYGGNFYGTYTNILGTRAASAAAVFTAYPNPVASGQGIDVVLAQTSKQATYILRNALGQAVGSGSFSGIMAKVPTVGLAPGTYILSVQPAGEQPATSRFTLQ